MPKSLQRLHPQQLMLPPLLLMPLRPPQKLLQPRLTPLQHLKHLLHRLQQMLVCPLTTHTA